MNTELKKDFIAIRAVCIEICASFNTFEELYFSEDSQELTSIAEVFFNDIARIMIRDWILQVCKLTDNAITQVRNKSVKNLTLPYLNLRLEELNLMTSSIYEVSEEIVSYGKKLKPARNKLLAHVDRDTYHSGIALGETSEDEMMMFLKNIQIYCDYVGNIVGEGPLAFIHTNGPGDVGDLLKVLRDCPTKQSTRY